MSADTPKMSKRSTPGEADGNGTAEGDAEGFLPSAMKEVLALLRVIDERLEERKKPPPAGPTRAAFAKLAKAVGAIGEDVGETRKQVGKLVEADPDHKKAVEAAASLAETLGGYRGDFGRWVEEDRRRRRYWRTAALAAAVPAALMLGILAQKEFELVALHDPSKGWSGWIWEVHGRAIVDCAREAMRTDAEVNCALVVRKP